MKVKDLKEFLNRFDDEQEVFAEEKINGVELPFDLLMTVYSTKDGPSFGLK